MRNRSILPPKQYAGHEWKEYEDDFLANFYMEKDNQWLADKLGLEKMQVFKRLQRLGLKRPRNSSHFQKVWTALEVMTLQDLYPDHSNKEIAEVLPRWTERQVRRKAEHIGLRKDFAAKRARMNY